MLDVRPDTPFYNIYLEQIDIRAINKSEIPPQFYALTQGLSLFNQFSR